MSMKTGNLGSVKAFESFTVKTAMMSFVTFEMMSTSEFPVASNSMKTMSFEPTPTEATASETASVATKANVLK